MTQQLLTTLLAGRCAVCAYPIRFPRKMSSSGEGCMKLTGRCNMCGQGYTSTVSLEVVETKLEK